jgi:hypothetical protein
MGLYQFRFIPLPLGDLIRNPANPNDLPSLVADGERAVADPFSCPSGVLILYSDSTFSPCNCSMKVSWAR